MENLTKHLKVITFLYVTEIGIEFDLGLQIKRNQGGSFVDSVSNYLKSTVCKINMIKSRKSCLSCLSVLVLCKVLYQNKT